MEDEKKLQYAILQYLSGIHARNGGDELGVAIQCLGEALSLDVHNRELSDKLSIAPLTLPQVFNSGVTTLDNPRFKKFYNVLKAKGYFAGVQEGTDAYAARLATVKEKYEAKFAEQAQATTTNPSSSTSTSFSSSSSSGSSASSSSSASFSSSSSSSSSSGPEPTAAPPTYAECTQPNTEQKAAANKRKLEGNSALTAGRPADAVQAYSAAIELNPFDAVFWANRAAAHANLSNWEQVRADAEQAVKLDARYAKAHYRHGQALLNLNRPEEAVVSFEKAIDFTANEADKEPIRQQLQQARAKSRPAGDMDPLNLGAMFQNNPQMMQMMQGLQQGLGSFGNLFGGT